MNRKIFSKPFFAIALTSVVMASCDNSSNQTTSLNCLTKRNQRM